MAAMADQRDNLILKSLKFLNTTLQAFEPGALAAHREIAGELVALRRRLSDFAPAHLDQDEAPEDPAPEAHDAVEQVIIGRGRTRKAQPVSVAVTERVNAILANFDLDSMAEADLLPVLRGQAAPAGKSHAETEDYSLGLLCLGYPQGSMESYKQALRKASSATYHTLAHYQEVKQRSSVMDQVADPEQRIQERHDHLRSLSGDTQAGCWALHVMQQVEALKFAMDWARLSGRGSALIKRRFYQDVFCAQDNMHYIVEGLTEEERIEMLGKNGELEVMFSQWKRTNERLVTGRNRLLTMYNIFGAAVLIDPLWSVETLGIRCSRTFGHVLDELAARMANNPQPFLEQQRRGRDVLVRVANAVEPNESFMSYIVDFVSTNAPKRLLNHSAL